MTLCTLNENCKIVISQLFSQQSSTTDLDVGWKYPLSSRWALIFPLKWFINKMSISIWKARVKSSIRIPGVAPDLFLLWSSHLHYIYPAPAECYIQLRGLTTHIPEQSWKKPKVTDMPFGFLLQVLVMVLYVVLGTRFHYLPAIWLQKFLFLCSSQELFQSH